MTPITILYADELLPYCPTVLNLESLLRATGEFDVRIVAYKPQWCKLQLDLATVQYRELPSFLKLLTDPERNEISEVLRSMLPATAPSAHDSRAPTTDGLFLRKALDLTFFCDVDWNGIIIAVDAVAAFAVSMRKKPFLYLSLELYENDLLLRLVNTSQIAALLIQSEARKRLLFPNLTSACFLLPNSPVFKEPKIPHRTPGDLVFAGTAWELFGFESCLSFVKSRPDLRLIHFGFCPEKTHEVIHKSFDSLTEQNRLVLDSEYRSADQLLDELAKCRVGLCFYRLDLASEKSRDNYLTAPSGKLANYFAAGLPVICSDLPAFQFVRERDCGVLVQDLSPESLGAALAEIETAYERMSANALNVAKEDCFSRHFGAIAKFLKENESQLVSRGRLVALPWRAFPIALRLFRIAIRRKIKFVTDTIRSVIRGGLEKTGLLTLMRSLLNRNADGTPRSRDD